MNQGPTCDSLMKKIGGRKSRGTIPLNAETGFIEFKG
jgi:hypothetical protein